MNVSGFLGIVLLFFLYELFYSSPFCLAAGTEIPKQRAPGNSRKCSQAAKHLLPHRQIGDCTTTTIKLGPSCNSDQGKQATLIASFRIKTPSLAPDQGLLAGRNVHYKARLYNFQLSTNPHGVLQSWSVILPCRTKFHKPDSFTCCFWCNPKHGVET